MYARSTFEAEGEEGIDGVEGEFDPPPPWLLTAAIESITDVVAVSVPVAVIVNTVDANETVGVPLMIPVLVLKLSPAGSPGEIA